MRPRPTMLLAVLVPLLAAGCAKPEWQEFRDPGGAYKVEMPGKPRRQIEEGLPVHIVKLGTVEYAVATQRLPRHARSAGPEAILSDVKVRITSEDGVKLVDEAKTTKGKWTGREWTFRDGGTRIVGRCFVSPGGEQMVLFMAGGGWSSPKHADRFFDSIEFLKYNGGDDADVGEPGEPTSPAPKPALASTLPEQEPVAPPSTSPRSEPDDGLPDLNPQPNEVAANDPPGFEPPTFEPPVAEKPNPFTLPEPEEGAADPFEFPQPARAAEDAEGADGFPAVPQPEIPRVPTAEVGTAEYAVQSIVLKLYHDDLTGLEEVISERASGLLRKLRSGDLPPADLAALKRQLALVKLLGARDVGRTGRFVTLRNSLGQTIEFTCRREGDAFRVTKATVR